MGIVQVFPKGEHTHQTRRASTPRAQSRRDSSPLTRGARARNGVRQLIPGLIPAHAGSTSIIKRYAGVTGAHPRSRGEHPLRAPGGARGRGSSPLTRGAQGIGRANPGKRRLIPAHAGSTRSERSSPAAFRAHPRSRGEHLDPFLSAAYAAGSSPLTRGARGCGPLRSSRARLIPAHAGSTSPATPPARPSAAHPRSRGEHSTVI